MSLWMLFVLLGLIKLPLIGLMLWMPFRNDEAIVAPDLTDDLRFIRGGRRQPHAAGRPARPASADAPPPLPAPRPAWLAGAPGAGPGAHAGAREGREDLPLNASWTTRHRLQ